MEAFLVSARGVTLSISTHYSHPSNQTGVDEEKSLKNINI
jgi:hypothetical protein